MAGVDIATLLNEHSIGLASYSEVSIESGRAPITLSIWEAEQDAAPTVVFVPGTMTHPLFYSPFLDEVSRHGYHVVGVHPLSHGRSPRVIRRFTLDDMIGNVRDAVSYACARFPGAVGLMGRARAASSPCWQPAASTASGPPFRTTFCSHPCENPCRSHASPTRSAWRTRRSGRSSPSPAECCPDCRCP